MPPAQCQHHMLVFMPGAVTSLAAAAVAAAADESALYTVLIEGVVIFEPFSCFTPTHYNTPHAVCASPIEHTRWAGRDCSNSTMSLPIVSKLSAATMCRPYAGCRSCLGAARAATVSPDHLGF
jgi:hypothetical protein